MGNIHKTHNYDLHEKQELQQLLINCEKENQCLKITNHKLLEDIQQLYWDHQHLENQYTNILNISNKLAVTNKNLNLDNSQQKAQLHKIQNAHPNLSA